MTAHWYYWQILASGLKISWYVHLTTGICFWHLKISTAVVSYSLSHLLDTRPFRRNNWQISLRKVFISRDEKHKKKKHAALIRLSIFPENRSSSSLKTILTHSVATYHVHYCHGTFQVIILSGPDCFLKKANIILEWTFRQVI